MSLVIDYTFDASVTDLDLVGNAAYDPTLYAEYVSAVQTAVRFYENLITNPITVNINFGWGEVAGDPIEAGAIGESSTYVYDTTYGALYNAVEATDTTSPVQITAAATLPATDPTNGGTFQIATAEADALGFDMSGYSIGGSVGLDSSTAVTFTWTQSNVPAGSADAVGTLEHEISEVLGRVADSGVNDTYTLLDMFRYTAADGGSDDAPGAAVGVRDEPFVAGYSAGASSYFSWNGETVTLPFETPADVANGADIGDWAPSVVGDSYSDGPVGQPDPVSRTDLEVMNVLGYDLACFLPDTQIATPSGEVSVQSLRAGDLVLTHRGEAQPIIWIGQGKALATRGRRNAATPVIVRKGALGDNLPNYDLRITKGHALYLDGVLIPAEFLVNHRSIVWDDRAREVEVYHIELHAHDVLLANGAPAESYRDDGNRWLFQNFSSSWRHAVKLPCAPVLTGGPVVDAIWQRLLARSGERPGLPMTEDPDLYLMVNNRRVDGQRLRDGVHSFHLPTPANHVRIASRAAAPDELGLARDPRLIGVGIRRIVLWRGRHPTVIEADDARLSEGFHAYEADNGFRWTNGDAVLPPSLFAGGDGITTLDLYVAGGTRYPLFENDAAVAA